MNKIHCIICGKVLSDGIMIYNRGMCKCCEQKLMNMDVNTDFYKYYARCLRKSIVPLIIRGEELSCQNYRF